MRELWSSPTLAGCVWFGLAFVLLAVCSGEELVLQQGVRPEGYSGCTDTALVEKRKTPAANAPPREAAITVPVWNYAIPTYFSYRTMGLTVWTRDPEVVAAERAKLGRLIEEFIAIIGEDGCKRSAERRLNMEAERRARMLAGRHKKALERLKP